MAYQQRGPNRLGLSVSSRGEQLAEHAIDPVPGYTAGEDERDFVLHFGPGLRAREVWFSPPTRMPMGLAVGSVTAEGRLHLVFRYRHPLFGPAEVAAFADRYVRALGQVAAGARSLVTR